MPDQNSTGDKVKFRCDKTPSCSKPHQGLFLKQYGAQMLFLLRIYHKVSSPTHRGHIFMYKRHHKVHFA